MKVKRLFSFLLSLDMLLSLSPVPALAEEAGESPAFIVQPVSGSHGAGESYLLTWKLNQIPDRLELVREEPGGTDAFGGPNGEDGPSLVPLRELDPESESLELTAPEEGTVFTSNNGTRDGFSYPKRIKRQHKPKPSVVLD